MIKAELVLNRLGLEDLLLQELDYISERFDLHSDDPNNVDFDVVSQMTGKMASQRRKKQSDIINESLLCSQSLQQSQKPEPDEEDQISFEPLDEKENSPVVVVVQEITKLGDETANESMINTTVGEVRKASRKRKIDTSALLELQSQRAEDKQQNSSMISSHSSKRLKSNEFNKASQAIPTQSSQKRSQSATCNFDDDDLDLDI